MRTKRPRGVGFYVDFDPDEARLRELLRAVTAAFESEAATEEECVATLVGLLGAFCTRAPSPARAYAFCVDGLRHVLEQTGQLGPKPKSS